MPPDRPATRERAFRLVADGVAAGLPLPSRISMLPGYRQLSLDVGDRTDWDSWRAHLDCADVSVRVYEAHGGVRRCSVARAARAGYRIAVELTEDVDTRALRESVCRVEASP